jgi:uncharacterized membrane protein
MTETGGTARTATPDPGPRWALGRGWDTTKDKLVPGVIVTLVYMVAVGLGYALNMGAMMGIGPRAAMGFQMAWNLLVVVPMAGGIAYAFLMGVRGEDPSVDHLVEGYRHLVAIVAANILIGIAVLVGLALLVLPGIYVGIRLLFSVLFIVDRDMGAVEGMKASWAHTEGEVIDLFLLGIANAVILFVGTLLLLVGILPALIVVGTALGAYYDALTGSEPAGAGADEPTHVAEPEAV